MPVWLLHLLNGFFLVFHTAWTFFNCVGWIWTSTRKLHRLTMLATAASWLLLAPWFGLGYCLCTDLHWRVRRELGIVDPERGYVQFLIRQLTGVLVPAEDVRIGTGVGFAVLLVATVWVGWPRRQMAAA